jgi:hypothetical protein
MRSNGSPTSRSEKSLRQRVCLSVPHGLAGCSRRRALRFVSSLRPGLLGETTRPSLFEPGPIRWTGRATLSALSLFWNRRLANALCHRRNGRCCVCSSLAEEVLETNHSLSPHKSGSTSQHFEGEPAWIESGQRTRTRTQKVVNLRTWTSFLKTRRMVFLSNSTSRGARCWKCSHISLPFLGLMRRMRT